MYNQQYYGGPPPPQQGGFAPPGQHPSGYPPGPPPGAHAPQGQFYGHGPPQGPPPGQWPQHQGHSQGHYNMGGAPPPPVPAHPQQAPAPSWGAAPSPGYDPRQVAHVDTSRDADALRAAMKGFGTDEKALIRVLAVNVPDPVIMANVRQTYGARHRRDLLQDVQKETSGYFRQGLEALIRGPLQQDVSVLHDALKGPGTKETALNDVLLARSNADLEAIKNEYHRVHRRSLLQDVKDDLSLKTERLFELVLSAQRADESAPIHPQQLQADVSEIQRATEGTKFGADQMTVCSIFTYRSGAQLRAIAHEYYNRFRKPLRDVIKKEFAGHMECALLRQLDCAEDRIMADAVALEEAMAGMGTKDMLLINRLVRAHWNRQHMEQVGHAYRHRFRKALGDRISEETSGDYKRLALALANPGAHV